MEAQPTLILHKEILPFLNISLHLNDIKILQSLIIENIAEIDTAKIEVKIYSDLACIEPFSYSIAVLPAKQDVKIPLDKLKVNRDFLNKLSETEKANIFIEIVEENIQILTETFAIDVHPLEHFGGFQTLPELIAAYVTPNHSYIYHIKRKAVEVLEKERLRTAFEGYQNDDPERVLQVMSAIFTAIRSENIVYSSLPPGYEELGQRLRMLNTLQQEKFGNCIDLSLLFAACLEAADLNPILIITRGHAFVGCWLQDDKFPEIIIDDKAAITKRISKGIRELAAVEATLMCKGNNISFNEALSAGEAQLVQKEDFLLAIDIKRARSAQIRPIPLLSNITGVQLDEEALRKEEVANMEKNFEFGTIYQEDFAKGKQPTTKQKIWERKLLDLSLRNNLLNLRMTRNMLQMIDIDISHLEDTLSEGKSFSIMPDARAEVRGKYNLFSQSLHQSSPIFQMANDELKYNRLLTHYHQKDLDNILTYVYKNAKQAIDENGSSTLYLAVGLLKWFDRKTPDQPRFAPILLLPVEINRRSVNSKFILKSRGEETMINITLVEFLRQEYELNLSALEQLPHDDKGVDVAKIMGIVRRAVMQLKGWDVKEQLVLGNFSFSKLILWKDIVMHQEDLQKNEIVRSLIEGRLTFHNDLESISDTDFDNVLSHTMALPIPTDVSQMEAVLTAQKGHSFILHGPPGTGKSQTITNIIADALYHGKRVLFVAAKKAALDVVHSRLEQIGLAPFSLELHSNKSKKSDVLKQLSNSIETNKLSSNAAYEREAKRLDAAKKALSSYVNVLHQKQPVGWSLYESITAVENYNDQNFPKEYISETVMEQLHPLLWQQWTDWLPQFQSVTKLIDHPSENPLAAFNLTQYSSSLSDTIASSTEDLLKLLPVTQQELKTLKTAMHLPFPIQSLVDWEQFVEVIHSLQNMPDIPVEFGRYLSDKENYNTFEDWCRYYKNYLSCLKEILDHYNRNLLNADISTAEIKWKQAQQSWFLSKWIGKRKIKKLLASYRIKPFVNDSEVEQLFVLNNQLQEVRQLLHQSRFDDVRKALNNLYKEEQTDMAVVEKNASTFRHLALLTNHWGYNAPEKWLQDLSEKGIKYFGEIAQKNPTQIKSFIQLTSTLEKKRKDLENHTGLKFQQEEDWFGKTIVQLQKIQEHLPRLKDWMNYVHLCRQAEKINLQWLFKAYEANSCNAENISDYFYYTVHSTVAQRVIAKHESLSLFNVNLFETKIEHYKKIAKDFQLLTIKELRTKLAGQIPNNTKDVIQTSEIGILQRAIKSKGRGLSIRRLFDQIPTLLPRIVPCMLMSPISVAQYFDVDAKHFDLVIFDEASQLPTCEAVSALARAKQAVIVGDPKQMPPTSFFSTIKLDEENMDVEDLESILDDCLALSVPSKYLQRHYRSKHESLIAFSNINFYENKLLTFPSADDLNRKVKYHHIAGFYDKGKTRTNKFEADAIVEYIKTHYYDVQTRQRSLGVVTFSQTQQNLVEDKLQLEFMVNPEMEKLAMESAEPLFIKNLENVQGDERDVILFSVGYAPDKEGKLSMNFGPLNRNGGWRRLNVAVTRARYEMHIFATLKADQIDLSRTSAEGVANLKAFLQYAEKGHLVNRPEDIKSESDRKHLSESISKLLKEKGLPTKCNIGTSDFKIDVGIIHPDHPQKYILGIVVDGLYYYNARTTNDREMVLPSVLKALGWNIHRVWSLDWYENTDAIIDSIIEEVNHLKSQPEITEDLELPEEPVMFSSIEQSSENHYETDATGKISKKKSYATHTLDVIPNSNSEMIYDFKNRDLLKEQIQKIIEKESPISKAVLFKKILYAWNTNRIGAKLEKYLEEIIMEMNLHSTMHHQPFYWSSNDIAYFDFYRSNDLENRSMEDIAPEELIIAITETVEQNLSLEEDELLRYIAKQFGFAKVGKQIDSLLRYAVDLAVKDGKINRENGRLRIVTKSIIESQP